MKMHESNGGAPGRTYRDQGKRSGIVMPFEIVRNDITQMAVDAIVNTANPKPIVGAGTDAMIHEMAGPELLKARQNIGCIDAGCAAITPAYKLNAKYVIHTAGPVWIDGNHEEEALLQSCYENALQVALENHAESIAFPLISTGNYGFPKDKALQIAISAISAFLMEHEMQIYLVVFDRAAFRLSEKRFQSVASYIDENYVDACVAVEYGIDRCRKIRRRRDQELQECSVDMAQMLPCASAAVSKSMSLEDLLKQADAGFTEKLLELIDQTGKKDSEIYKNQLVYNRNTRHLLCSDCSNHNVI